MARGRKKGNATDPDDLMRFGLGGIGGYPASLFPVGTQREQRVASRLLASLEICRPFAQRFFEHVGVDGPTRATRNIGTHEALALLEPTFAPPDANGRSGAGIVRADGAIAFRKGSRLLARIAFEVKYLQEGRTKLQPARLRADQVGRTHRAARAAGFDHVITISAAEWDGERHPSGFDPRSNRRTGLAHISWLGVLRAVQATRQQDEDALGPGERRLLADFERYLMSSEIWTASRSISMGGGFKRVRDAAESGTHWSQKALPRSAMKPVAVRWVRLAEVIANVLSIETDHDVICTAERPRGSLFEQNLRSMKESGALTAGFRLRECSLGRATMRIDMAQRTAEARWTVEVADLIGSRNARASTRWNAVMATLEAGGIARSRRVEILGSDGPIIPAMTLGRALNRVELDEVRRRRPEILVVTHTNADVRSTSTNVAPLVETMLRGVTPW